MKKLMFAAAVAAISTATLADIVSSSVVGYQNKELKGNSAFNLTVATFQTVGKAKTAMTLGDIGASADWVTGEDQVKTLTANGAVDQAYTYVTPALAAEANCTAGWYLTDDVLDEEKVADLTPYCKNDTVLPLGNGLLVLVGSADTTITYSGEVLADDQPITLKGNAAFNITGNISPANITLGDIVGSSDWVTGEDQLKTLTANGAVDQAYTYVTPALAAEAACTAGWYLTDDVLDEEKVADLTPYCKNAVAVDAGEAFIVLVGSSATTITIPSAL